MQNFEVISSRLYLTFLKSFVFLYTHLFHYYYINIPKRSYRRETIRTFEIKHTAVNISWWNRFFFNCYIIPPLPLFNISLLNWGASNTQPQNTSTKCNPNLKTFSQTFESFSHWQYRTSSFFAITTKQLWAKMYLVMRLEVYLLFRCMCKVRPVLLFAAFNSLKSFFLEQGGLAGKIIQGKLLTLETSGEAAIS